VTRAERRAASSLCRVGVMVDLRRRPKTPLASTRPRTRAVEVRTRDATRANERDATLDRRRAMRCWMEAS
jgi:hypothetical protein